ncbi:hypothetical protein K432DRAFT_429412, partial [Lepidopterella palustris CBS 459.81]
MSESFDWNFPGLSRTHFNALANLLSLRNGGQVEPASLPDEVLDEDCNDDWDAASVDTRNAHQISDSGYNRLKRKFLDCLAEFAANKQSGKTVTCTAMKEAEDNVTFWIARNGGFPDQEKPLFNKLSELLSKLSCGKENKAIKDSLWNEMLSYHQDRIQSNYIPSLRASFKDNNTPDNNSPIGSHSAVDDGLSVLRKLAFDVTKPGRTAIDKHNKLVTTAYELRMTKSVEEALQSSPGATTKTKKLWVDICLLARLRVAFQKFEEIALKLPSFHKVTIILLPRDSVPVKPPERPLSLKQTFDVLNLSLDSPTVKSMIGQRWALNRVEQEFIKRQKQKLNIHAEVQMLLFLCSNEPSIHALLPYFGCSKFSCFMCARFLQSHGRFATRGCHGRLFKPWTVPETAGLGLGQADQIAGAVIRLQRDLKKELKSTIKGNGRQEKTSAIGGSSILSAYQAEGSRRQSDLERRKLKAEQERVAEMFKRQSLKENRSAFQMAATTSSSKDDCAISQEPDELGECYNCPKMTSRQCSICNRDLYCSEYCQDKRSGLHLFTCSKRPLTSADYLFRYIGQDVLPEDKDVLEDFGFNQLTSFADQCKLLGLYKGLYLSDRITEEDLHKWQVEGTLVANIKEFYYQIPETHRGGYFPWFLKHTHILERRVSSKEATENMIATFYDQARSYLDSESQHKKPQELKPEAKAHCYRMLAGALHMAHPHPIEYNWYTFGFCTCREEQEERRLGGLYQELLIGDKLFENARTNPQYLTLRNRKFQTATFTEFWHSYQSGTLIHLMDSKGLKEFRTDFPFLEEFLSVPPSGPHPSVWDLKQFIAINDPVEYPPIPALLVDYGFMNCQTFEETCILMEIYKRILQKADPLELHKACLAGKLFVFAQMFHAMDEGHKRLMKNVYPL